MIGSLPDAPGEARPVEAHASVAVAAGSRREQLKALGIATLGGMLEYFEFVIYFYLAPYISQHFFSADTPEWLRLVQTFAILAAGYLMRPIGGIWLAGFGDAVGRKKVFMLTLFLMAGPTMAIGLLPTYAQVGVWAPLLLLLCRMLQGLSMGGELPGAVCFVAEHLPARRVCLACGVLAASLTAGALLGSVTVGMLTTTLGAEAMREYGWRIPFLLGGVFGLVSVYLRRFARETPVFEEMKARKMLSKRMPLRELFSNFRVETLAGMAMACMTAAASAAVVQYPITFFVSQRGLAAASVLPALNAILVSLMVGNVVAGWLADRLNRLVVFTLGTLGLVASLFWLYSQTAAGELLLPGIVVGLFAGVLGMILAWLATAFAPQVRYTGIATSYNIPLAVIGGLMPVTLVMVTQIHPIWAAGLPALFCLLAIIGAWVLWPRRIATDHV